MESPFVAAARELLEETGIRSIKFVAQVQPLQLYAMQLVP